MTSVGELQVVDIRPVWHLPITQSRLVKNINRNVIAPGALCAVAMSCWKWRTRLRFDVRRAETAVTASLLWLILLDNLDSVIDKCAVNHVLLADWCCQWLNANCVRIVLSRRLSCWLMDMHTVSHSAGFFGMITVNIFSSANKYDANIIGWIFLCNCFKWQSPAWKLASLSFGWLRFLSINISQGRVATRLRRWDI